MHSDLSNPNPRRIESRTARAYSPPFGPELVVMRPLASCPNPEFKSAVPSKVLVSQRPPLRPSLPAAVVILAVVEEERTLPDSPAESPL